MNTKIFLILSFMTFSSAVIGQDTGRLQKEVDTQAGTALELCIYLHQNPELSYQEFETSRLMALELEKMGFKVTRNFGGNNVVGLLKNGDGPVIMLRTDMDALPIEEKTGFEFASKKRAVTAEGAEVPVMHACGHDIHMSVWLGTLRTLVALKDEWEGTLLVIAQESEEVSGGATKAIREGIFTRFPVPDAALAYHINPELASGTVGISGGPVFAGVKTAHIRVFGEGGHGAYPEKCIDPIVIASRIVLDLQTIVSREISPLDPAVVTVGSIHGGTRPNIIPDEVNMELTLRYYSEEVIEKVVTSIRRIAKAAAMTAGMPESRLPEVTLTTAATPPLLNDESLANHLSRYAGKSIGTENVLKVKPAMVGEDFGKYSYTPEKVPVCMIWLGSTHPALLKELKARGEEPQPLHSPMLNPDYAATIRTGILVMSNNVINLMNSK
jgi:amidohydrolase